MWFIWFHVFFFFVRLLVRLQPKFKLFSWFKRLFLCCESIFKFHFLQVFWSCWIYPSFHNFLPFPPEPCFQSKNTTSCFLWGVFFSPLRLFAINVTWDTEWQNNDNLFWGRTIFPELNEQYMWGMNNMFACLPIGLCQCHSNICTRMFLNVRIGNLTNRSQKAN